MSEPEGTHSNWLVIVPTVQLTISNDSPIGGQWKVGNVTFMSKEAMAEYLHQPNLPIEPSDHIRQWVMTNPIMGENQGFAVTTRTGTPTEIRKTVFRDLREAAHVLVSTIAIFSRSNMRGFTLQGWPVISGRQDCFLDLVGSSSPSCIWCQHGMVVPFELDANWHNAVTASGMINLFDRISDRSLDPNWQRQIRSGAAMLGKSLLALERADAFLLDVMGLETLLTVRGGRNGDKLSNRIKGMVGWHLRKTRPGYEGEIKLIHKVRCDIVHDSDYSNLTTELLLQADMYLVNSLMNIVNSPAMFPDKDTMIAITDGYAEKENWPTDGSVQFRWIGNPYFNPKDLNLTLW